MQLVASSTIMVYHSGYIYTMYEFTLTIPTTKNMLFFFTNKNNILTNSNIQDLKSKTEQKNNGTCQTNTAHKTFTQIFLRKPQEVPEQVLSAR